MGPPQVEGDEGDRLAEAHVVGQAAAQAQRGHEVEPGQAPELVVPEGGVQARGRLCGLDACRQAVAEGGQRADRDGLHGLAVDLRRAGEGDGQGVDRVEQAQFALAGLADEGRVDQHPLVPQPYDRAVGLGQGVHLGLGERVAAEGQLPAELEEFLALEEAGAVGRGARCRAHDGRRRQVLGQVPGPVDGDPGRREPGGRHAEQFAQLLLGEGEYVRHVQFGEAVQRGPDARGPPYGQRGVHACAGAERGVGRARPQGRRVHHEGRVGEAVHLDDRRARAAHVPGAVEQVVGRQVQAERDPHARVHACGDLGGPVLGAAQPLRRTGREGHP